MKTTASGIARVTRKRVHKAKPLESTDKRQDPRKAKGKVPAETELITWSVK